MNSTVVRLFYNTARFWLPDHLGSVPPERLGVNAKAVNIVALKMYRQMRFPQADHLPGQEIHYHLYGLPMPDALITGGGSRIQINPDLLNEVSESEIAQINRQLASWLAEDALLYSMIDSLLAGRLDMEGTVLGKVSVQQFFATRLVEQEEYESVNNSGPRELSVSPQVCKEALVGYISRVYVQNVSVNKGSTLRILIDLMMRNQTESRITRLFAFGDELMDLSFIRPDLEGEVLGPAHSDALAKCEARLQSLGVQSKERKGLAKRSGQPAFSGTSNQLQR